MAFTKENEYKVEVMPDRLLLIRRSDIIKEDGVVVATSYHRHMVAPGDDYTAEPTVVQLIAERCTMLQLSAHMKQLILLMTTFKPCLSNAGIV